MWDKGNQYRYSEVNDVNDIGVSSDGWSRSQHGGFYPELSFPECCQVNYLLRIRLSSSLSMKPEKGVKYTYHPHENKGGELTGGGSSAGTQEGSTRIVYPVYGEVLAHERGHAKAFLEHFKPCFLKAVNEQISVKDGKLSEQDKVKIRGIATQCRRDTMDKNVEFSNKATLDWYKENNFNVIPSQTGSGLYEFRLK